MPIGSSQSQARPDGAGRYWLTPSLEVASYHQLCTGCGGKLVVPGVMLSLTTGATFNYGLGAAIAVRRFQEFSFENHQQARYVIGALQYSPRGARFVTLNVGAGRGTYDGDELYRSTGDATVVTGGVALRITARSRFAATLSAEIIQAVGGNVSTGPPTNPTVYRPRQLAAGFGLSIASP